MLSNQDVLAEQNTNPLVLPPSTPILDSFFHILKTSWQRIAFWFIMALAVFLRFYQFPNTPAGMWVDEATEGYDAYALLQHGTDRWGNPFPVYFPGWGSGQNVLQAYLSIPFIKLFGLSIFSIRLVPAILGVFAVYLLYSTVKKIYNTNTALLASFLLASLPWYVMATRWSMESNILPFFFLFGVWALTYSYDSPRCRLWMPFSLIPLALAFYAYGTSIVPIPIFLFLFLLLNYKTILKEKVSFILSILIFLLVSAPFLLYVVENDVLHRALPFLAHLPITIPYLPANRLDQVNEGLSHSAILVENLRFAVSGFHDNWLFQSVPWVSPLGWLMPPFVVLGVYFSLKRQPLSRNVFVFWLIATLPTFVLFLLNVVRSNVIFIPLIMLAAYGIVALIESIQPLSSQKIIALLLIGSLIFPSIVFYQYYFRNYNKENASLFSVGYDDSLKHALSEASPNESIYIHFSNNWASYADTLFYLQLDAKDFYTHADIKLIKGVYWVSHYGRFYFSPPDPSPELEASTSYVAILRTGYTVSCQHYDVLYRTDRGPNDQWTVLRCFPKHTLKSAAK
ncbi:hypothetical protein KSD_25730 [Ktedonobacter sp. SOSP1-85]|uniref:ArnT family glycosyltransferase n=1 Tax=Ktedonobacter sp. SOSP1-85 TaxID=2778367 RepID=UPI00191568CA|nr:glycosyltransferase family 39 protein [Ktedonobacter sp. SOSP1-85]GHO74802.1 hypothetical protein KSD_25730 [Ktedonobacter sp. SOSP1-85]